MLHFLFRLPFDFLSMGQWVTHASTSIQFIRYIRQALVLVAFVAFRCRVFPWNWTLLVLSLFVICYYAYLLAPASIQFSVHVDTEHWTDTEFWDSLSVSPSIARFDWAWKFLLFVCMDISATHELEFSHINDIIKELVKQIKSHLHRYEIVISECVLYGDSTLWLDDRRFLIRTLVYFYRSTQCTREETTNRQLFKKCCITIATTATKPIQMPRN